jgi:ribA/ribD-fused uncharacterized protein
MRVTDEYVFFWGGPFSQWHIGEFKAELPVVRIDDTGRRLSRSGDIRTFSSCEKNMMAWKACAFSDTGKGSTLERIMAIDDPEEIKAIGRKVPNLRGGTDGWDAADNEHWDSICMPANIVGNYSKFSQNDRLHDTLMRHGEGGRTFVEGSPKDTIWGVGLKWDDSRIDNPANWRGPNKLGQVLTTTYDIIAEFGRTADIWKVLAERKRREMAAVAPAVPIRPV